MKRQFKSGQLQDSVKVEEKNHLYKKAILCRTGIWNEDVLVTKEILELIVEFNNKNFINVINENSYPPVQFEHKLNVFETCGRIDIGQMELSLEDAKKYNPSWGGYVLIGVLRIFDDEAKKGVEIGKYNHLSISFDDETGELFEVSFVAVEAARGSQILSKKPKRDKGISMKKLSFAKAKVKTLAQKHNALVKTNVAVNGSLVSLQKNLSEKSESLSKSIAGLRGVVKRTELASKFNSLVREGKLAPVELKEINLDELAVMPKTALSAVMKSYDSRKPSGDMFQVGDVSSTAKDVEELTDAEFDAQLEAQRTGKKVNLSQDVEAKPKQEMDDETKKALSSLSSEPVDMSKVLEQLSKLTEEVEKLKSLSEEVEKMKKLSDEAEKTELSEDDEIEEIEKIEDKGDE